MQTIRHFAREWIVPHVRIIAATSLAVVFGMAAFTLAKGEKEPHATAMTVKASAANPHPADRPASLRADSQPGPRQFSSEVSGGIQPVAASIAADPADSGAAIGRAMPRDVGEVQLADATEDERSQTIQADFEQVE